MTRGLQSAVEVVGDRAPIVFVVGSAAKAGQSASKGMDQSRFHTLMKVITGPALELQALAAIWQDGGRLPKLRRQAEESR
jgi:hypothetical protein